jgi:hypothetical protein
MPLTATSFTGETEGSGTSDVMACEHDLLSAEVPRSNVARLGARGPKTCRKFQPAKVAQQNHFRAATIFLTRRQT